jgi:flagellar basal-body rod modification protein FlgD
MIDTTTGLGQSSTSTTGTSTSTGGSLSLSNDDFLRLLVTQLKFQDPLNPVNQNELLAQTAQLTTIEQMQKMNAQLADMKTLMSDTELTRAASLIGRTATLSGGEFTLSQGSVDLGFTVLGADTPVTVEVRDADGALVRTMTTSSVGAGAHAITWDGRDDDKVPVGPGTYTYHVSAAGAADGSVPTVVAAQALVTGFERRGSDVVFRVGGLVARLEDFVSVQ